MSMSMLFKWIQSVLILYTFTSAVSAILESDVRQSAQRRECDEIRQELISIILYSYDKKTWPTVVKKLLPKWNELTLPVNCGKIIGSTNEKEASIKKLLESASVFSMKSSARRKRGLHTTNFGQEKEVKSIISEVLRKRRSTIKNYGSDTKKDTLALNRVKRFLLGTSLGGATDLGMFGAAGAGPAAEVSESAQLMNSLLMYSKLQRRRLTQEYNAMRLGGQAGQRGQIVNSYAGDRIIPGTGMYGDSYHGRKRREVAVGKRASEGERHISRKKRFIFGAEQPAEQSALLRLLYGNARDPYTGQPVEMGGDMAKRAYKNLYSSYGMVPPGKEPSDYAKDMAPYWMSNGYGSPGTVKSPTGNGFYGDALPGRKRRKRTAGIKVNHENGDTFDGVLF